MIMIIIIARDFIIIIYYEMCDWFHSLQLAYKNTISGKVVKESSFMSYLFYDIAMKNIASRLLLLALDGGSYTLQSSKNRFKIALHPTEQDYYTMLVLASCTWQCTLVHLHAPDSTALVNLHAPDSTASFHSLWLSTLPCASFHSLCPSIFLYVVPWPRKGITLIQLTCKLDSLWIYYGT